MNGWRALSSAMWLGFLRDRTSQFFYFLFPLMFLVLFGLLLGNPNLGRVDLAVVGGGPIVEHLPAQVVNVKKYDSFDSALEAVRKGNVAALVRQEGDTVEFRYSAINQVAAGTTRGIVEAVVGQANQQASGRPPVFHIDAAQVENTSFEPIQFLTAGILSWGIAMGAAFGAALNLVTWRKSQVLRRIRLAPVSTVSLVGARMGVSLLIALLQTALFIGVAMTPPFGLQLTAQSWMIIPLVVAGTLAFMSIGTLVGSLVKTEEAASGAVNIVVLPMAFLSGAFFDPAILPAWLDKLTWVLPMKHMSAGVLDVLVRKGQLGSAAIHFVVIMVFALVLGLLAARLFNWEDA